MKALYKEHHFNVPNIYLKFLYYFLKRFICFAVLGLNKKDKGFWVTKKSYIKKKEDTCVFLLVREG